MRLYEAIAIRIKEICTRDGITINALAKSVTTGEITDYTGGLDDLKNKTLRVLHDESFIDELDELLGHLWILTPRGYRVAFNT